MTPKPGPQPRLWLVTVVVALVITYGSLYPFEFRIPIPLSGLGPVGAFLASIGQRPGRGDTLANILLYMPLGFFLSLRFRRSQRRRGMFILVISIGSLMSLSVELAQYYIPGRVTSFNDLATNTLGMVLGSLAAIVVGAGFRMPCIGDVAVRPAPSLLVLAWLAYRLYPYVPTIDLHKYWNSLKPIVLTPSLTGYELCRQTATWPTVYALIEAIVRRRRSAVTAPIFAVVVLCAKVLIVGLVIRLADPLGAGLAFGVWLLLLLLCPIRLRTGVAGLVLCAYVVALRLEPFTFQAIGREFGWLPFRSLMQGSLSADTPAFLEKVFLYGSMIYLLGNALGRLLPAAMITAALLFAASWAEAWLPGRSAEITDTLMAVIVAVILALLPDERETGSTTIAPRPNVPQQRLRDWQREQARMLGVEVGDGR